MAVLTVLISIYVLLGNTGVLTSSIEPQYFSRWTVCALIYGWTCSAGSASCVTILAVLVRVDVLVGYACVFTASVEPQQFPSGANCALKLIRLN